MNVLAIVIYTIGGFGWLYAGYVLGWGRGYRRGRAHRSDYMLQIVRHTMRETTREVRDMEEKRVAAKWN